MVKLKIPFPNNYKTVQALFKYMATMQAVIILKNVRPQICWKLNVCDYTLLKINYCSHFIYTDIIDSFVSFPFLRSTVPTLPYQMFFVLLYGVKKILVNSEGLQHVFRNMHSVSPDCPTATVLLPF